MYATTPDVLSLRYRKLRRLVRKMRAVMPRLDASDELAARAWAEFEILAAGAFVAQASTLPEGQRPPRAPRYDICSRPTSHGEILLFYEPPKLKKAPEVETPLSETAKELLTAAAETGSSEAEAAAAEAMGSAQETGGDEGDSGRDPAPSPAIREEQP